MIEQSRWKTEQKQKMTWEQQIAWSAFVTAHSVYSLHMCCAICMTWFCLDENIKKKSPSVVIRHPRDQTSVCYVYMTYATLRVVLILLKLSFIPGIQWSNPHPVTKLFAEPSYCTLRWRTEEAPIKRSSLLSTYGTILFSFIMRHILGKWVHL